MVIVLYNTFLIPGIILTIHVSRKERTVVTVPMKRNFPKAPIQMPSTAFCRIGWCIGPTATIAISLPGMVHYHQDGQANLQIIEIIFSHIKSQQQFRW